jgi:peptidoglycan/xylan/chitin deacetylase (PgdA/CDA1 family)
LFDLVGGHLSLRRAIFDQVGGFDRRFTHAGSYGDEDLDLGTRLADEFDVRFNPQAIAHQRYVVTPAQNIEQWYQAGRADVAFARKHPRRARELFELHGAATRRTRLLLRPLSRLPLLPRLVSRFAAWLAAGEQRLPRVLRRFAALLFYAARDVRYWTGVRDAGGVPAANCGLILCYHAIADLKGDAVLGEYGIPPQRFARQLDSLLGRGFVFVRPDEFVAMLDGEAQLPRKALLLTFDDCYEELAEVAGTLLEPRGIPGIAFAVSGVQSGTNEWDQAIGARTMRLLDAEGLQLLRTHGVEIGCHSRSHRPLPSVPDGALTEETVRSADDLAALGLPRPRFFAYPHGVQDGRSRAAVQAAGFAAGFGLSSRRASRASDRFALPRIEILASDGPLRFWLKTRSPRLSLMLIFGAAIPGRAARKLGRALELGRPVNREQTAE